jgi:hypothetical protein
MQSSSSSTYKTELNILVDAPLMNSNHNNKMNNNNNNNINNLLCRKKLDFSNTTNQNNTVKQVKSLQMPKSVSNSKRNARERKRVRTINDYFSQLQKYLPHNSSISSSNKQNNTSVVSSTPSKSLNMNKKMSKVETLKAAIDYIEYLLKFAPASANYKKNIGSNALNSTSASTVLLSSPVYNSHNSSLSNSSFSSSSIGSSRSNTSTPSSPAYTPAIKKTASSSSSSDQNRVSTPVLKNDSNSLMNSLGLNLPNVASDAVSCAQTNPAYGSYSSYNVSYSASYASPGHPTSMDYSTNYNKSQNYSTSSSVSSSPTSTSSSSVNAATVAAAYNPKDHPANYYYNNTYYNTSNSGPNNYYNELAYGHHSNHHHNSHYYDSYANSMVKSEYFESNALNSNGSQINAHHSMSGQLIDY